MDAIVVDIIFEDDYIIVIKKPSGLAVQTANVSQKDCVSLLREHLKQNTSDKKIEPYVGVVHRLDQPVAGLLVFAKDEKSAAKLSAGIQNGEIKKQYKAVVQGIVEIDGRQKLESLIYKDTKSNKAYVVSEEEQKKLPRNIKVQKAVLYFELIKSDDVENVSYLDIELLTGRFHQIRAQLSSIGHPIAGDRKYDSQISYKKVVENVGDVAGSAISLVADRLSFIHPVSNKKMYFTL